MPRALPVGIGHGVDERERRHVRQMAHEREDPIVNRCGHLLDAHARRLPERVYAPPRRRCGAHAGCQDTPSPFQEVGERRGGAGVFRAGDRVAAAEPPGADAEDTLDGGDDRRLHAASVSDHRRRRQRTRQRPDDGCDRLHRRRDDDQIGAARGALGITLGAIDDAAATRDAQVLRRAPEPDHLADDAARTQRQRQRAADQADAGDDEAIGDPFHVRGPSTAARPSTKRSFSAGVPTVTRRWRGSP